MKKSTKENKLELSLRIITFISALICIAYFGLKDYQKHKGYLDKYKLLHSAIQEPSKLQIDDVNFNIRYNSKKEIYAIKSI
ncbi:hypothetical protein HYW74_01155 [Candidatus Pacearchaeota archaeon]|nr:hypothetical protein [Candidatus Pacearchaeota archaeon]MBI4156875.1 hypothetical protein [Candidatus Woesearchaeota archaeon]